jgi:transposase-like protein
MTDKKKRIIHSPEFKAEALKLAEKVGVVAAARQLSLHESQIYGWREAVHQQLDIKVKKAFDDSKERDGSRRIQKELAHKKVTVKHFYAH